MKSGAHRAAGIKTFVLPQKNLEGLADAGAVNGNQRAVEQGMDQVLPGASKRWSRVASEQQGVSTLTAAKAAKKTWLQGTNASERSVEAWRGCDLRISTPPPQGEWSKRAQSAPNKSFTYTRSILQPKDYIG